ncbi:MAG: SCP2 sterol-binding domain-containing protein [Promethearchaeota archaeon]
MANLKLKLENITSVSLAKASWLLGKRMESFESINIRDNCGTLHVRNNFLIFVGGSESRETCHFEISTSDVKFIAFYKKKREQTSFVIGLLILFTALSWIIFSIFNNAAFSAINAIITAVFLMLGLFLMISFFKVDVKLVIRVNNYIEDFLIINLKSRPPQGKKMATFIREFWEKFPFKESNTGNIEASRRPIIIRPQTTTPTPRASAEEENKEEKGLHRGVERLPGTKVVSLKNEDSHEKKAITSDTTKQRQKEIDHEKIEMSLEDALGKIIERYNGEKVRSKFSNWKKRLMLTFPDINKSYIFHVNGSDGIKLEEAFADDSEVKVEMDSVTFIRLLSKKLNAIKAYSSGLLNVKGSMKDLLKLRKLMF